MLSPTQTKRRRLTAVTAAIILMLCATAIGAYAEPAPSVSAPAADSALALSLSIKNGGLIVLPASADEITAQYDEAYYDVAITPDGGQWHVTVRGKVADMGHTDHVRLYVPETKRALAVQVRDGSFTYVLAAERADTLQIDAADASLTITSPDQFATSAVALSADAAEYMAYGLIQCPDYFTKQGREITYTGPAAASQVDIRLTGYTSVTLAEGPGPAFAPDAAGLITIPVAVDGLTQGTTLSLGAIPDIVNLSGVSYQLHTDSLAGRIRVSLRQPPNNETRFFSVEKKLRPSDHAVQTQMKTSAAWTFLKKTLAKSYSGPYQVTIESLEGELTNVSGTITLQYSTAK